MPGYFQGSWGLKLLFGLCSIWAHVLALTNLVIKENGSSQLTSFKSDQGFFNLTIDPSLNTKKYFIIEVSSPQEIVILYGAARDQKLIGSGLGDMIHVSLMSEILKELSSPLGFRVQVKQPQEAHLTQTFDVNITICIHDHVTISRSNTQKVFLHEISELPIEYVVAAEPLAYKTRVQITSPHLGEPSMMSAFVNFDKSEFPTSTLRDFELHHIDAHKLAFLASKDDTQGNFFCKYVQDKKCSYKILLKVDNKQLPWVFLDAHHVPVREPIIFGKSYYDYYPRFGTRIYVVNINNSDLRFSQHSVKVHVRTIHGAPNLFVNPEYVPEFADRSVWKATDLTSSFESKSISISPEERMTKIHNITVLYIMVNSNTPSSYLIHVEFVSNDAETVETLQLNEIETLAMPYQTMKNFEISVSRVAPIYEKSTDAKSSNIKISTKQLGNGKLDLFGFLRGHNTQKKLAIDEILGSNTTAIQLPKFVKNDLPLQEKSLEIDFICDNKTSIESRVIDHRLTEYICFVTISAVVWSPHQLAQDTNPANEKAKFQIVARSQQVHQRLFWSHPESVRLSEGEKKLFQLNFHQGQVVGMDGVKASFSMIYGKVSIHMDSKPDVNCNPSGTTHVVINLQDTQKSEQYIDQNSVIKLDDIKTALYVCISAQSVSEVTLEFSPNLKPEYRAFSEFKLSVARNIPPEEHLVGEITNPKEPLAFRFHANLQKQVKENKDEAYIKVHVTPIKGCTQFRIAVSNNGQLPKPNQAFWNTVGDSLIINASDQNFMDISEYVVAIYAVADSVTKLVPPLNKFMVTYSIGTKHVVLKPGVVFSSLIGTLHPALNLKVVIPPGTKNFTFLKSSVSAADYEVSFSFDMKNQYPNTQQSNMVILLGHWGAFLDTSQFKVYCPHIESDPCTLFIGLRSYAQSINSLVVFTYDDHPITLKDESVMKIPAPTRAGIKLNFVYHIPVERIKEKFILLQEMYFNPYQIYLDFVTETELATKTTSADFPSAEKNKLAREPGSNNQIEIESNLYAGKDVMLITLESREPAEWSRPWGITSGPLAFNYAGNLVTQHHITELQPGVRCVIDTQNNSRIWSFYKFHHSTGDNILISIENLANTCWMSVVKGKEVRPNAVKFLARSYSNLEDEVTISPEMLPPGDKIQGDYIVGVFCLKSDSKFSLLYRPDSGNYLHISMNMLTQVKLYQDKENYLEFANFGGQGDIKIGIKTVKSMLQIYVKAIYPEDFNKATNAESRSTFRPTITNYHFKAASAGVGGLSFLIIPKNSQYYCETCNYIALVETDQDEKTDVLIRKALPFQPVSLMDGKQLIGTVSRGESDLFSLYTPAFATVNALQLRVISGTVTLQYSQFITFPPGGTTTVNQYQQDEQFRMSFDGKTRYGMSNQKYIRIVGTSDSQSNYTLTYMQNNQVEQLAPSITQKVPMGSEFSKFYYFPANNNYSVEVKLTLAYVWNGNFLEFNQVRNLLPKFLTFYYVDGLQQVYTKRYSRRLVPASTDMFNHQLTYRLKPMMNNSTEGYVVVRIDNRIKKPLSLLLELAMGSDRYLQKMHSTAEMLTADQDSITYHINVEEADNVVQLKFGECLNNIKAEYKFEPVNAASNGATSLGPFTIFNQFVTERSIYLYNRGKLSITFSKNNVKAGDKSKPKDGFAPKNPWTETIPTIFSFGFEMGVKSNSGPNDFDFSQAVTVKKDSQYVLILDGSVRIPKVEITELARILQTHNVYVNYTMFMSSDERMTNFMAKCHGYGINYAEQSFDTSSHHSVSTSELISNESFWKQQQEMSESKLSLLKAQLDYITLKPRVFGYGDIYKATVIAKVLFFSRTDTSTFPLGQEVELSYGDFEIKGDKYGYLILGAITFCVVLLAALCFAVCVRHGIVKPLLSRKLLSAFDTQAVADQLVLEISDYRHSLRNRSSAESADTTLDQSTQPMQSFEVSGVHETRDEIQSGGVAK